MKKYLSIYSLFAVVGLLVTGYYNLQYMGQGGSLMPSAFWLAATPTALTTAITLDVYLAALVFSIWVLKDAKVSGVRFAWGYVALTFFVGLCVAWPLYLHFKAEKNQ
jgi:acid phosphatase family membrane protein YuiD